MTQSDDTSALNAGFYAVPPGHLATVVTYLEMRSSPEPRPERAGSFALWREERPNVDWYRGLFRRVGAENWLWFSRLVMEQDELEKILHDELVEVWVLASPKPHHQS